MLAFICSTSMAQEIKAKIEKASWSGELELEIGVTQGINRKILFRKYFESFSSYFW